MQHQCSLGLGCPLMVLCDNQTSVCTIRKSHASKLLISRKHQKLSLHELIIVSKNTYELAQQLPKSYSDVGTMVSNCRGRETVLMVPLLSYCNQDQEAFKRTWEDKTCWPPGGCRGPRSLLCRPPYSCKALIGDQSPLLVFDQKLEGLQSAIKATCSCSKAHRRGCNPLVPCRWFSR